MSLTRYQIDRIEYGSGMQLLAWVRDMKLERMCDYDACFIDPALTAMQYAYVTLM